MATANEQFWRLDALNNLFNELIEVEHTHNILFLPQVFRKADELHNKFASLLEGSVDLDEVQDVLIESQNGTDALYDNAGLARVPSNAQ